MTEDETRAFLTDLRALLTKWNVQHFGACSCCVGAAATFNPEFGDDKWSAEIQNISWWDGKLRAWRTTEKHPEYDHWKTEEVTL